MFISYFHTVLFFFFLLNIPYVYDRYCLDFYGEIMFSFGPVVSEPIWYTQTNKQSNGSASYINIDKKQNLFESSHASIFAYNTFQTTSSVDKNPI